MWGVGWWCMHITEWPIYTGCGVSDSFVCVSPCDRYQHLYPGCDVSDNIELGHTFTSTVTKKYKKNGIFGLNDEKINHMPIAYPSLYAPPPFHFARYSWCLFNLGLISKICQNNFQFNVLKRRVNNLAHTPALSLSLLKINITISSLLIPAGWALSCCSPWST